MVLSGGLQRIGDVAADVIRFTHGVDDGDLRSVAPAAIAAIPAVHDLAVSTFPDRASPPLPGEAPVCARWRADVNDRVFAEARLFTGNGAAAA